MVRLTIIALLSLVISANSTVGQYTDVQFEHVSLEQGVSNTLVWCIYQDRKGFLWYGTMYGLIKYNGYEFTTYRHDPADTTTLSNDDVVSVCEDRRGDLWIGTYGGGLNRLDRTTGKFSRYLQEEQSSNVLGGTIVWSILETRNGTMLFGTESEGLLQFNPDSNSFEQFGVRNTDVKNVRYYAMLALCEAKDGTIWVGTRGGGVKRFDPTTGKFTRFKNDPANPRSLSDNSVSAILQDRSGTMWIGTEGGGLNKFDAATGSCIRYLPQERNPNSIAAPSINRIIEDKAGQLWIATGGGLSRFDKITETFVNYRSDPSNRNSLSSDNVTALLQDQSGIIWIGTYHGGLDCLLIGKRKFSALRNPSANNEVSALLEDRKGSIWIGTKDGLSEYNDSTKHFTLHIPKPGNSTSLSGKRVTALCEDSSGALWVGTQHGLNRMEKRSGMFKRFFHIPSDTLSVTADVITSLYVDRSGSVWVGTHQGLVKYNHEKNSFTRYHDRKGSTSLPSNYILSIYEDKRGVLWVGTYAGLSKLDKSTGRFTAFRHRAVDTTSLSNNYVLSMLEDSHERFWIGTGGGLNLFDRATETFRSYSQKDGLPNSVICGVLEDAHGALWLSTNRGLSKFNPETKSFMNYDRLDGLQSNMFFPGSAFKGRDGKLMFGGIAGFNMFQPNALPQNTFLPPLAITQFMVFDDSKTYQQEFAYANHVALSYKENFFALSFAALDFTRPEKNQYAYQLEGFDNGWIHAGRNRFARYTNLDPGEYVFRVRGSNNDGVWNEQGTLLRITISPPFWKTTWFRLLAAASMCALGFAAYRLRLQSKMKQLLTIENARREEAEIVRKKAANDFHDELGHRLTKIGLFTEIVKRKLANASPEIMKYLDKISDDSQNLTSDTRDFIWTLDPDKDSLFDVAIHLKDFGEELFDRTGIAFSAKGISEDLLGTKLPMETRRHVTLIFKEGMNNILKHSSAENVTFAVELLNSDLRIALMDDGRGYASSINTGYGLKNMQQRAEKIHSAIRFNSEPGQGSTIELTVKTL